MKILILKPSSLGDVVQALPVLRLLKRHRPADEIHWWIDSSLAPLLEGDPDLAGLVLFERRRWGSPRHWPELAASVRGLRSQRFDLVIDLQGLARSGLFAWLANGASTVGILDRREGAYALYDRCVPRPSPETHAVDWYLSVLQALDVPVDRSFVWLPERPPVARAIQAAWPVGSHPWVALQPGARWDNKRWPAARFAELASQLAHRRPELRFVVLGGLADAPLAEVICQAVPQRSCNLAGRTSLPEMVEWLRACAVLVTNDTGPMHVAAALGKPVVAVFGPTNPRRTGPYHCPGAVLQNTTLPCVPCLSDRCRHEPRLECLTSVGVEPVRARVESHL